MFRDVENGIIISEEDTLIKIAEAKARILMAAVKIVCPPDGKIDSHTLDIIVRYLTNNHDA